MNYNGQRKKYDNPTTQQQIAEIEKQIRYKIMYGGKNDRCPHGLVFNGRFCSDCASKRFLEIHAPKNKPDKPKVVNFWDIPIVEDKRVPTEHPAYIVNQKTGEIKPMAEMSPDPPLDDSNVSSDQQASKLAFEIIEGQLDKLTKDHLQELYEKLHNTYDRRMYK